jgi:hypothetical protein
MARKVRKTVTREQSDPHVGKVGDGSGASDVNRPTHYISHPSGIECIEVTRHMNFNLGNAMKYIWRASSRYEDELTPTGFLSKDLAKAIWYLRDEIARIELAAIEKNS